MWFRFGIILGTTLALMLHHNTASPTIKVTNIPTCQSTVFQDASEIRIGESTIFNCEINLSKSFYAVILLSTSTSDLRLSTAIGYGDIDICVSINTEPAINTCNYKSLDSRDLVVIPGVLSAGTRVNIMLTASARSSLISLVAAASNSVVPLVLGIPFRDDVLSADETRKFSFLPLVSGSYTISLTSFTRGNPNLAVYSPREDRTWSSSMDGGDYVTIVPTAGDIADHVPFKVVINADQAASFAVAVNIDSTSTTPSTLLGGFPHFDFVGESLMKYFTLTVPRGNADVVITVDTLFGDADLYVNVLSSGFFLNSPNEISTWDSAHSFGTETVFIESTDSNFQALGGVYLITILGYAASEFVLRGYSASSAIVIVEGHPLRDFASRGSYHYYKIYDNHPDEDLAFNVFPVSGDPDIFIGCNLQLTGDDSGLPSRLYHHYNYSSMRVGEDTILVPHGSKYSCRNHMYYGAVYAFTRSEYSITTKHTSGAILLVDGWQVSGELFEGVGQIYNFRVGPEPEELVITLTSFIGDADLFVRNGHGICTLSSYDYRSTSVESDGGVDSVTIPETALCTNCWVSILVYSWSSSQYSIVASLKDTTLQLADGVPLVESVAWNDIQYYVLQPTVAGNVSVVLTIFSGTPYLCASTSMENPTADTPDTIVDHSATMGNIPDITIKVLAKSINSNASRPSPVYIGVGGHGSNSTFSIRANLIPRDQITGKLRTPLLKLIQGVPQRDTISVDKFADTAFKMWKYYQIDMAPGHKSISVRATSLVGSVDLYIKRCPFSNFECAGTYSPNGVSYLPNQTSYLFSTAGQVEDWVDVTREDTVTCSYIIGVLSTSSFAEYQVSFIIEDAILKLQAGVMVNEGVISGSYSYFSFYMPMNKQALRLILTTSSGDPDLFVSTKTSHPTLSNYSWKSVQYGQDTVLINPRQDKAACWGCTYYIGAYGFQASTFSLIATLSEATVRLIEGVPVSDHVDTREWIYYTFFNVYRDTRNFKVIMSSTTGDADMYVTIDGTLPNTQNFVYFSGGWGESQDIININSDEELYDECLVKDCTIIIGVFGYDSSDYTIVLSSSRAAVMLQMGKTQVGSVSRSNYEYYSVPARTTNLTVTVNLFSGHVTVYYSCKVSFPNSTSYSVKQNPEVTSTLSDFSGCDDQAYLNIAVYGVFAATFSISAWQKHDGTLPTTMMLLPGISASGTVAYRHFDYYYVRIGDKSGDINLIATVLTGDVDLYVSSSWETRPVLSGDYVISFEIDSAAIGTEDLLIRHSQIAEWCRYKSYCYLIVGALGSFSQPSEYRLLVTIGITTTLLQSGIPTRGHVDGGFSQFYMFAITNTSYDVQISATAFFGDPDIYVSLKPNTYPSGSNFTWMTAYWGDDTITIQSSELKWRCQAVTSPSDNCMLYIGVSGYSNCSFSVTASMNEGFANPTRLVNGQQQSGSVSRGGYSYYRFIMSSVPAPWQEEATPATAVTFTLTPTSNGDADMYIILRQNGGEPGRYNSDYHTSNGAGQVDEIRITPNMKFYCDDCVAYIAVFGFSESSFSIVATTTNMIGIVSGLTIGGMSSKGVFRYYSLFNADSTADIMIDVAAVNGDPDVYIGTYHPPTDDGFGGGNYNFNLPTTSSNFIWKSISTGSDIITISIDDDNFCFNCYYIIGVYPSNSLNCTYHLLVSTKETEVINLIHERPQVVSNSKSSTKYFRATEITSTEDMIISATKLSAGFVTMYFRVYNSSAYNGQLPDPSDPSTYSMKTKGDDLFLRIPYNLYTHKIDDEFICVIAVEPDRSNMKYSIVVTTSWSTVALREGQPQTHVVSKGFAAHFSFYIYEPMDLHISLVAREGDPDLLVSMESNFPSCKVDSHSNVLCTNYTWRSASASTDQIIISRDSPCSSVIAGTEISPYCDSHVSYRRTGNIYIAVFGYQFSKFTLTVSPLGRHVSLLTGIPQLSVTSPGFICSSRDRDSGVCMESRYSVKESAQVSYFSFTVNPGEDQESVNRAVIVSVYPVCQNGTSSGDTGACYPGCPCKPLSLYIRSCSVSKCTEADAFPSRYLQNMNVPAIDSFSGSTVVMRPSIMSGLCDPAGQEPCRYFINVLFQPHGNDDTSAQFSVIARSEGDIALIPCGEKKSSPDGIRQIHNQVLTEKGSDYFEVCNRGTNAQATVVTLESCYGSASMYACSSSDDYCKSFLPTYTNWGSFSDSRESCTISSKKSHGNMKCIPNEMGSPTITLMDHGNYYVQVNGTGNYILRIKETNEDGVVMSPKVVSGNVPGVHISPVVIKISSQYASISWPQSSIMFSTSSSSIYSEFLKYHVYVFNRDVLSTSADLITNTFCGVQNIVDMNPSHAKVYLVPALTAEDINKGQDIAYKIYGLKPSVSYLISVAAVCDSECLREIGKTVVGASEICAGAIPCQSQVLLYSSISLKTASADADMSESESWMSGWSNTVVTVLFSFMIVLIALIVVLVFGASTYYWYMKSNEKSVNFGFDNMRTLSSATVNPMARHTGNFSLLSKKGNNNSTSTKKSNLAMTKVGYSPPSTSKKASPDIKSQSMRLMAGDDGDDDIDDNIL